MSQPPTILVVDDDRAIRLALSARIHQHGYTAIDASSVSAARGLVGRPFDVALVDHRLPDGTGVELLAYLRESKPELPVIVLTGHASVAHAVEAMQAGAFHYAAKPIDLNQLMRIVERGLEIHRTHQELSALRAASHGLTTPALVGRSPQLNKVNDLISRIAASPGSTVLVTGESGTGKDLVARAIHTQSQRHDAPFLNITCSALPAALLESELFGHERGAFTDAKQRKIGLLEHASGGTVFLDEIGEMDLGLQAKLLRFLEDKTFRPVGGNIDIQANVRFVAATNVDLREAVKRGQFREDLYYRLAVLMLRLPPLRERESDPEFLALHFVARFSREFDRPIRGIDSAALQLIRSYPWPGNVRELKNAIERAVLLARGEVLTRADFDMLEETAIQGTHFVLPPGGVDMREVERSLVQQALERTRGNRTRAARLLGMNRDQIRYRIEHFGLADESTKTD